MLGPKEYSAVADTAFAPRAEWAQSQERQGGARDRIALADLLLAAACGLIAANVYYAQPLAGSIGPAIGLSPEASGLVVTLT